MYSSSEWPIGAALLQFPATLRDGTLVQDASVDEWAKTLTEVKRSGLDHVDLTDTWLRPGDLTDSRREELSAVLRDVDLLPSAISVSRRSILDPEHAEANLAYTLRTVDAAAGLGVPVVCLGLHRALTPAQRASQWFWLEESAADALDDDERRTFVTNTFRDIGRYAAELGVAISLEMYEDTFLGTAADAVHLVTDIDLPNVGLNPDIGNLVRLHRPIEPWQDMLEATLPYTNYWHVKNYQRDYDPGTGAYFTIPMPLELGVIDYRLGIELAIHYGFSGPICVEHYGGDGLSVAAGNARYLRRILATKLGE